MNETTTRCSQEQRNDWRDLHERLEAATRDRDDVLVTVALCVLHSVDPEQPEASGTYLATAQRVAREEAAPLAAEVERLRVQLRAHPYNAELLQASQGRVR
jgi:hypothetical protein